MLREVDIDEISDGKRYKSQDMVKLCATECDGCSSCCHGMGDSIILDPYDVYKLQAGTGKVFSELLDDDIMLNVVDGLIQPNIRMQETTSACGFLNNEGRCKIHQFRPGFCRLFPLGRIYEGDGFSYFLQIKECNYPVKSKVKIKKWLGIDNLSSYEKYILEHHNLCKKIEAKGVSKENDDLMKRVNMLYLNTFFVTPYDVTRDFYEQYYERNTLIKKELGDAE